MALEDLFAQDPNTWSDSDIDEIISSMRSWRASFEAAESAARATNTRTPTRAIAKESTKNAKESKTTKPDLSKFFSDLD